MSIEVKRQSFPVRCEICHQADCFDAHRNWCDRCEAMKREQEAKAIAIVHPLPPSRIGKLFCKIGIHSWQYSRWERNCRHCETVQHIWRIFGRVIEWRTDAAFNGSAAIADLLEMELPLPLRRWRCASCSRTVMRVHRPGHFERCPRCGKEGFANHDQKEPFPQS